MEYPITYEEFQKNLAQGKFIGLKCDKCGTVTFPPMAICHKCCSSSVSPITLSGKGKIRTFTVIRVAPEGKKPPYIIGMVELEEGPCAIGNIIGIDPENAGMELMGKEVVLGTQVVKGDVYSLGDAHVLTFTLLT